ncbi:MAG TPA: sulfite exporter TauE/SafE family protein [Planctomycetes bacterium]|nr:sulfite exporter TauE/SafE family protein [Planctomycetota bacterium]
MTVLGVPLVFDSLPQWLGACLILILAEGVYVSFGFGSGLIAVGLMALVMDGLRDVVVILLLVNIPVEIAVVASSRRIVQWKGVTLAALGLLLGVPGGTWLLGFGNPSFLLLYLAVFLMAAGLAFLLVPGGKSFRVPSWTGLPVGLTSGILAGLFGTGGPPVILYYQLSGAAKTVFRGNLMALFFFTTLVRTPTYLAGGLITPPRIWSALAVLPAVGLGAWLGNRIHIRMSETAFRRLVSVLLVLLGLGLLLR